MKKLLRIHQSSGMHWVGNGFPVRFVFGYNDLGRELSPFTVQAKTDAKLLVMDGEPFDEPVVGQGPFVMNSRAEIQQAFEDYHLGRMGEIA
jgi:hypothetical protein